MNMLWINTDDPESPVKFGFTPELREELQKERTADELIRIADECGLMPIVKWSVFFNSIGFYIEYLDGPVEKVDGNYYIKDEESEDGFIRIQSNGMKRNLEFAVANPDQCSILLAGIEDNDNADLLVLTNNEGLPDDEFDNEVDRIVYKKMFQYAKVKTARELGRFLNRNARAYYRSGPTLGDCVEKRESPRDTEGSPS